MGKPIEWHGTNKKLLTPMSEEDDLRIKDMSVFNNGRCTVSCWQLSKEELAEVIQNDGKVYLAVLFGQTSPPVFIGTEDNVRMIAMDAGGSWKRKK